jgi:hypothetical protein
VPDFIKRNSNQTIRHPSSDRDAISAVKLSEGLTADVDAWAEAHETIRSDAIRQLIELGLSTSPIHASLRSTPHDPVEIENLAVEQIDQLLDPSLPAEERKRRIRRLTEGPPEFSEKRVDLPRTRKGADRSPEG